MRELLFKNCVSKDRRKTELFLSEHLEKDGIAQDLEKKISYAIKDILEFTDICDLEVFLQQKAEDDHAVQTFIISNYNTKTGMARFIYKIVGEQYLVLGDKILVLKVSQYIKKTMLDITKECNTKAVK